MNLYLLRPTESTEALVVVAADPGAATQMAEDYEPKPWPNLTRLGAVDPGIHAGVLVAGHLFIDVRSHVEEG